MRISDWSSDVCSSDLVRHGDDLAELDQPGLACRVGDADMPGKAQAGDGGDVDDDALALLLHDRQDMLAGQEDVLEVVVDLTVPHFFRHFDRTARRRAADIVVQNVDAAEAVEAGGDRGGYRLGIGDIGPMRGADAALVLDGAAGPRRGVPVGLAREDACAFAGGESLTCLAGSPTPSRRTRAGDDNQ